MGNLNKLILKQFIEFECERQLFINLSKGSDLWLKTNREIKPLKSIFRGPPNKALKFGREYEQEVYNNLKNFPSSKWNETPAGEVTHKKINIEMFSEIDSRLQQEEQVILLEHGFLIPQSFFRDIFQLAPEVKIPVSVDNIPIYPDILIFHKSGIGDELNLNGTVTKLTNRERNDRIGINIVDVKKTPDKNVNKNHFIEIIYYGLALRYFLEEHSLTDKFYVNAVGNGILPGIDNLRLYNFNQFMSMIVIMAWSDMQRLFDKTKAKIFELWSKTKCDIEDTDPNVKSQCGRCEYYDDCMATLGSDGSPKEMNVKLLPYTSNSTTLQLKEHNIISIHDLIRNISTITVGDIPRPIYSELPILDLKGRALYEQKEVKPDSNDLTNMSIPKFNDITICMNFEEDPLHSRVFGMSLKCTIGVNRFAPYFRKHEIWWEIWNDHLNHGLSREDMRDRFEFDLGKSVSNADLREMKKNMEVLFRLGAELNLKGGKINNREGVEEERKKTTLTLEYALVNLSLSNSTEYDFIHTCIGIFYHVFRLTTFMEEYITHIETYNNKDYIHSPTTAVFYWSQEILSIINDLVERHLSKLLALSELNKELAYLISWFTPSESMVKDEVQLRKIFDLRRFIEVTQGLPFRINYTWHGIYKKILSDFFEKDIEINRQYWSQHFNYMDHNNWYLFLEAKEASVATLIDNKKSKSQHAKDIEHQLKVKVRGINRILGKYQYERRDLISKENKKPARNKELDRYKVPSTYHDIARIWYLFSKLNGAYSELEAAEFRHQFPLYSIGKLAAAEISSLKIQEHTGPNKGKTFSYILQISGLSSNMKIKEKERILLLPNEERDYVRLPRKWQVTLEKLEWLPNSNILEIHTNKIGTNVHSEYQEMYEKDPSSTSWFIYKTGGEFWSNKLQKLLANFELGRSWLGKRLAYLWGINTKPLINPSINPTMPEIYSFFPTSLIDSVINENDELKTTVKYIPNQSQKTAIVNSLNNVVSAIQGPPGTGKSQTIITLIDEFIIRFRRNPKILITAFSYQALNVLLEKVAESNDINNSPTSVSKIERIYLRSSGRDPHPLANDLIRRGTRTWRLNNKTRQFVAPQDLLSHFDDGFLMFGIAHQLYYLGEKRENGTHLLVPDSFSFDLIIVDEASQMPVDNILPSLFFVSQSETEYTNLQSEIEKIASVDELRQIGIKIRKKPDELTKLVLVGDNNQLPPVQPVPPPEKLEKVLGSLFSYYIAHHKIPNQPLEINYRSHQIIVEFTRQLGFYQNLIAAKENATQTLMGDYDKVKGEIMKTLMDPNKVVSTLIHNHQFETAISMFEAQMVTELIMSFYYMRDPQTLKEIQKFFIKEIGVVAPHNAHGRLIIKQVFRRLKDEMDLVISDNDLMNALQGTIFSVEKFQGSDRNFIIGSIGISSTDQLSAEEEFIYEINRFNVLSSRAKNKMILICSRNFLEYFPSNRDVMAHASKIKQFAFDFCDKKELLEIMCQEHKTDEMIELRFRDSI